MSELDDHPTVWRAGVSSRHDREKLHVPKPSISERLSRGAERYIR
jgi:hypothetical protein